MKLKTIVTGAVIVLAFCTGAYVGLMQQIDAPPPPAPETPRHSQMIADLRKENLALQTEVARLKTANAKLAAPSPTPASPAPRVAAAAVPPPVPAPATLASISQQKAIVNNLRQISSTLKQFQLIHGRAPTSIHELVGDDKFIKKLVPVDGEDYSQLSLVEGQLLTLTTPNGVTVTFDPAGAQTTRTELPPVPAHILEMQRRIEPALKRAHDAYKAAHPGTALSNNEAGARMLVPYFSTPQEGADFVELLDAMKSEGRIR